MLTGHTQFAAVNALYRLAEMPADAQVCSIDPPGCRDVDDALHVFELPNGDYECGVHIADVTYFVREGTPLDEEARLRGTTIYLTGVAPRSTS